MSERTCVPPPRRKSCAECIKAKRRCDLARPRCLRCTKHDIDCDYGPVLHPKRKRSMSEAASRTTAETRSATITAPDIVVPDVFSGQSDIEGFLALPADVEDFINTEMMSRETEKDALQFYRPTPMSIETPNFDNVSSLIEHRLSYAIQQLKLAPIAFAEGSCTPWSHANLYETDMPSATRELQAACALYAVKNETNSSSIWRNIEGRAEELFESERPTDSVALLAYTQAMLLYQIMRFFGGNSIEMAKASAAMQQLEETAYALYNTVDLATDSAPPLSLYPTAESSAFWRSWIFKESQRRTYVACFMFLSTWNLLNAHFGYCAQHAALISVWTASAHLWEATNVFDFTVAWQSKQQFIVRQFDFTQLISEARADDVDTFAKMLLIGAMGVDGFKGWLYTRGGMVSEIAQYL